MKKIYNLKTLHEHVDIATRHAADHAGRIENFKSREKAIRQEIQDAMAVLDGPARVAAERIYQPELTKRLLALRAQTDVARWHFPREIEAIRAAATEMRSHLTNSIVLATVTNLGSDKRIAYGRTVEGLGARSLATLAKQASATGDKELASEVILANDKLPANDRLFSSKKLADELWAEESQKAQTLYNALELSFDRSMALLRESEGRPTSGNELIASALKHGRENRLLPPEEKPDELETADLTPNQQLAAGLAIQ